MATDKHTTITRRIARKSKYTITPLNIHRLERELSNNSNNPNANRVSAIGMARNENELRIR